MTDKDFSDLLDVVSAMNILANDRARRAGLYQAEDKAIEDGILDQLIALQERLIAAYRAEMEGRHSRLRAEARLGHVIPLGRA